MTFSAYCWQLALECRKREPHVFSTQSRTWRFHNMKDPKIIQHLNVIFPEGVWAKGSSNSGGMIYIFTSSHLLIVTSTHIIFTSSHLHILSSHLLSLSLPLYLFLSLSLSLALCHGLSPSFFFSLLRPRAVPTRRHEMATLSHEMRFDRQNCSKIGICKCRRQPFRTNRFEPRSPSAPCFSVHQRAAKAEHHSSGLHVPMGPYGSLGWHGQRLEKA